MAEILNKKNPQLGFKHNFLNRVRSRWLKIPIVWKLKFDFVIHKKRKAHVLPAPLIVSLTSYPARFKTLPKTLKCLLNQSVIPDKVILWIAHEHKNLLTKEIKNFKNLDIRFCEDLKSYKKIIPALQEFGDAFIVTADDDLYYRYNWLEELTDAFRGNYKEVICHRAHGIVLNENNLPLPYLNWGHPKSETESEKLIFPTCGAGALFPPKIFFNDVTIAELFQTLCPNADDIWLWWMVRLNNGIFRKIGEEKLMLNSSSYNQIGLWYENMNLGGNDKQMLAMTKEFGLDVFFNTTNT